MSDVQKEITFIMSSGPSIKVSYDDARQILNSSSQIVPILRNGEWTGKLINKSFIVSSDISAETKDKMHWDALNETNRKNGLSETKKYESIVEPSKPKLLN